MKVTKLIKAVAFLVLCSCVCFDVSLLAPKQAHAGILLRNTQRRVNIPRVSVRRAKKNTAVARRLNPLGRSKNFSEIKPLIRYEKKLAKYEQRLAKYKRSKLKRQEKARKRREKKLLAAKKRAQKKAARQQSRLAKKSKPNNDSPLKSLFSRNKSAVAGDTDSQGKTVKGKAKPSFWSRFWQALFGKNKRSK